MLDSRSLDVISKFKLALLTKNLSPSQGPQLARSNRGKKLTSNSANPKLLKPKIVEYEGQNHVVLTNDVIERSNYKNKRRWLDFYRTDYGSQDNESSYSESDSGVELLESSDNEENEENPIKRLRLGDLLAPLAHPSEIVSHPAISRTYKLGCLSKLASELIELIEVEQNTLNKFNRLLLVLDGEDWQYLLEHKMGLPLYDHGLDENVTSQMKQKKGEQDASEQADVKQERRQTRNINGDQVNVADPFFALPESLAMYEALQQKKLEELDELADDLELIQQDLINYLQVSIQRQYEYIRNVTTIRNGIVRTEKYKNEILRWGKEMSEKKS